MAQNKARIGEKQFLCDLEGCTRSYSYSISLKRHVKIAHLDSPVVWRCEEPGCGEVFLNKQQLNSHSCMHLEYMCDVCQKTFRYKSLLKRHLFTHTTHRPFYKCGHTNCNAKCLHIQNLIQHIQVIHLDQVCHCEHDGCSRTFRTKRQLEKHLMRHKPTQLSSKKKSKSSKMCQAKKMTDIAMEMEIRGESSTMELNPPELERIDLNDLNRECSLKPLFSLKFKPLSLLLEDQPKSTKYQLLSAYYIYKKRRLRPNL